MTKPSSKDVLHPSEQELEQFLNGQVEEANAQLIEQHLDDCEQCQLHLKSVSSTENAFVKLLKKTIVTSNSSPAASPVAPTIVGSGVSEDSRKPMPKLAIPGYQIVGELGRGGMGVVYHAINEQLKRPVALKVLLSGSHAEPVLRERFVREAETIAKLQHPGIVQIFEVGESEGNLFIALELIEGGTLSDFMEVETIDARSAAAIIFQLASTLEFAHQRGIVHRDLKPCNVLIQPFSEAAPGQSGPSSWSRPGMMAPKVPRLKITDFGLAKDKNTSQRLTQTGMAVGTPFYMSPEQALGQDIQTRPTSDIYSLGAMLYELLTGRPPFEGEDYISTISMVIENEPLSPRSINRDIPRELETICLKCLEKAPGERYQNSEDLANDLNLFLSGEPILARPLSPISRTLRWSRRQPLFAGTLVTATILYMLHLFMSLVVGSELHQQTSFRVLIGVIMVCWVVSGYIMQLIVSNFPNSFISHIVFSLLCVGGITGVLCLDRGPQSPPTPLYFLVVVSTALVSPKPLAVWTVTAISIMGYLSLVFWAVHYSPENKVSTEEAMAFSLLLVVIAAQVQLILRRNTT